jgi:hypothetical protein
MRLAALGFGLYFVLGFLLLFGGACFRTLVFLGIHFRLGGGFSFLLGASSPSSLLPELSPLIDLLLPLLFYKRVCQREYQGSLCRFSKETKARGLETV